MPDRPTSYPRPIFSRPGVDRPQWRSSCLSGLAIGLLAISSTAIGNDCADELRALPLPADAAEVYRDDQVVLNGRAMCQVAYTTHESVDTVTSLYKRHWEDEPGDLFRMGSDDGAILTHSGGLWERYAAIEPDGAGHAVVINIMADSSADPSSFEPYLPLPDGFELFSQQQNRDGFSLVARTPLAPEPATGQVVERLEKAGWHVDEDAASGFVESRYIAMSRSTDTLQLFIGKDHDGTQVVIDALAPVSTDE